jgi:hypothetical protein
MFWKSKVLVALCLLCFMPSALSAEEKSSWFASKFVLGNSVGLETFVAGRDSVPQWTTSFTIEPSVTLPLPSSWPQVLVGAEISANVWWLNSMQTTSYDVTHRIQFPDLIFVIAAPKIYEFEDTGISFSAAVPIFAPISKKSLALARLVSFGLSGAVKWKYNQFSLGFAPMANVWIHSGEAKTIDCYDSEGAYSLGPNLLNPQNVDFEVDQYMMPISVFRDEESSDGSTCVIAGRQNTWTLKLPLGASFGTESHRFAIGLAYYWNFLRPLEFRPELSSQHSTSQAFTQAVMGQIAYTYVLPLPVDLAVTAGVISYQSVFSKTGTPLFPFFDFVTPIKNQTQLFVEMTATL